MKKTPRKVSIEDLHRNIIDASEMLARLENAALSERRTFRCCLLIILATMITVTLVQVFQV